VYKGDQARQLARNYISACHRLAYYHLGRGEPEGVFRALAKSDEILSTLPREWMQIRPSQAVIEVRLVDGLYGPEAAMDTLLTIADEVALWGAQQDDDRLRASAMGLAQIAEEFAQEAALRDLIAEMDDGSPQMDWLRIEVDLGFGNFISAWDTYREMESTHPDHPLTSLTGEFMSETANTMDVHSRLNLTRSAIFSIFEFSDPESLDRFVWIEEIPLESVFAAMVSHMFDDRTIPACAAGLIIAERLSDEEAGLVEKMVDWILRDPDRAVETCVWFTLEGERSSWESVAWQCAAIDRPDLCWFALALSGNVPQPVLDDFLRDPDTWIDGIPQPGRGTGSYQWVNTLIGE
jgi:hypothetical protein